MMRKKSVLMILTVVICCASIAHAFTVFVLHENTNAQMRIKISTIDDIKKRLSRARQTLMQLKQSTQQAKQKYHTRLRGFKHINCANGATAEIVSFADKHNISIRKIEHQPVKELMLPQSQQSWSRIETAFQFVGDWHDYLRFRNELAASSCLLQTISERIRAAQDIFNVAVDLSLFVLQPQTTVGEFVK